MILCLFIGIILSEKFLFLVENIRKVPTFSYLGSLYHWSKIVFQNSNSCICMQCNSTIFDSIILPRLSKVEERGSQVTRTNVKFVF
jgi:hypothetical protein